MLDAEQIENWEKETEEENCSNCLYVAFGCVEHKKKEENYKCDKYCNLRY